MKTLRLIVVSAVFTTIFALSAFAQVQPAGAGKVGVIDPRYFEDDKLGITKIVQANTTVENEFKPRITELQTMRDKMTAISKEGQAMVAAYEKTPGGVIGPAQIQAKNEELDRMQIEFKRKNEDLQNAAGRRTQQLTAPIYVEIRKALDEFAKQKGYSVVFDATPLGQTQENPNGISIFLYVDEKADVTKDFIAFCNAKFAASATPKPTTPK
jgi:Skp family chaperone for outer membrane proteins